MHVCVRLCVCVRASVAVCMHVCVSVCVWCPRGACFFLATGCHDCTAHMYPQVELLDEYGQRVTSDSSVTVNADDSTPDGLKALAGLPRCVLVLVPHRHPPTHPSTHATYPPARPTRTRTDPHAGTTDVCVCVGEGGCTTAQANVLTVCACVCVSVCVCVAFQSEPGPRCGHIWRPQAPPFVR